MVMNGATAKQHELTTINNVRNFKAAKYKTY